MRSLEQIEVVLSKAKKIDFKPVKMDNVYNSEKYEKKPVLQKSHDFQSMSVKGKHYDFSDKIKSSIEKRKNRRRVRRRQENISKSRKTSSQFKQGIKEYYYNN